jgi:multiple sugar transport system permease protein
MLNPEYGLVNQVLRLVGIEGPLWLATPRGAMAALILVTLWTTGSTIVIYLAALQEIPAVLYEAAVVDGAGPLWRFLHVTVPGLSPVILFNCVLGIITSWQVFALPYVLFKATPGPGRSTYFYSMYLFDNAFRYLKMGYASALGWIQFLIILAATGLLFAGSRRLVHYRGAT